MLTRLVAKTSPADATTGEQRRLTGAGVLVLVATVVVMWFGAWAFWFSGVLLGGFEAGAEEPPFIYRVLFMLASGLCLATPIALAQLLLRRRWLGMAALIATVIPLATLIGYFLE